MNTQTMEVDIPKEKQALLVKLIDRTNKLEDEIRLIQSVIKANGNEKREEQLLHDELDILRDYREVTLERIAVMALGDKKPPTPNDSDYQPAGLGSLGELDADEGEKDPLRGWDASVKK